MIIDVIINQLEIFVLQGFAYREYDYQEMIVIEVQVLLILFHE